MPAFIVRPSRPGSIVAAAYALKAQADKAEKKASKNPAEPEPTAKQARKTAKAKG
jgi:hypothetical protein